MRLKYFQSVSVFLFCAAGLRLSAVNPEAGFRALEIYDYFKAKKIFTRVVKKSPDAYACYGLATIFYRTDNPFHHADSALRYLNIGWQTWQTKPEARQFGSIIVDEASYRRLADSITTECYRAAVKKNTAAALDTFLAKNFLAVAGVRQLAIRKRDELEFNEIKGMNKSDATAGFMLTHPGNPLTEEAAVLYDRQVFEEMTVSGQPQTYFDFIQKFPQSRMAVEAQSWLYDFYSKRKDVSGLAAFVKAFPNAHHSEDAWKLLFSLSVKSYNYTELKRFLDQYPGFPLKNTILRELELNRIVMYPYSLGETSGYISDEGQLRIPAVYHSAGEFRQGLALVHRNDSAWFVNKENINPFDQVFREAGFFTNGIAPVLKDDGWYFLNRLGQVISPRYEEVSEISDGAYVVKQNGRYGAVDQYAQIILEPRFEKLGDFVNGFAYYTADGIYGFVNKNGAVYPAEFGWVSDFSTWQQAVVKVAGKFGLVDGTGKRLLETVYDQVLRQNDSLYVIVKGDHYGFWYAGGCFVYDPDYDYHISVQSGKFTNGSIFKLNRKKQQALGDANGHLLFG